MNRIRPENPQFYLDGCLELANRVLAGFRSPNEVAEAVDELNAYPGLSGLADPRSLLVLDQVEPLVDLARKAVLEGRILWEHPAAGEATRLGLGPKFFLRPAELAAIQGRTDEWAGLRPVSLGLRHLLQLVVEIIALAKESGLDPEVVLARQFFLLVGSEEHIEEMSHRAVRALAPHLPLKNIWLMAQASFRGLDRGPGRDWHFDPGSPLRLHNHGHMVMQKTMDKQIYYLDGSGVRHYFSRAEFFSRLAGFDDLISNSIEDLDFLSLALDLPSLGLAARLGSTGHGMMMEINGNNRKNPVKGGMCAHDRALGRDVVIESFRLKNVLPKDIKYLNKNMNHYLEPAKVMAVLADNGIFMPVVVHNDRVYFQPVQGDINFLVKTAFFTRVLEKELNSLKFPADIPPTLAAMAAQDAQPLFQTLSEPVLGM